MSHITRITVIGLLLGALTSGLVQALPIAPETHLSEAKTFGVLSLVIDRLASLIGLGQGPADRGTVVPHGSASGEEKEGLVIDPNGHH